MPNVYSENSRRITYVEDRELFEYLEEIAAKQGVTVGELIRRATAEKYSKGSLTEEGMTLVSARFRRSEPAAKKAKAAESAKSKKAARKPRNKKYGS